MPKKGCLGSSLPLIVGILAVILVLFLIGFASGPLGKSIFGDLGLPSWLSVSQPHPELPTEVIFHLFGSRRQTVLFNLSQLLRYIIH